MGAMIMSSRYGSMLTRLEADRERLRKASMFEKADMAEQLFDGSLAIIRQLCEDVERLTDGD